MELSPLSWCEGKKDENTEEVTIKTLSEKMNNEISHEDLDRMHRTGNADRNDGKSRPIIIKFARYAVRNNVYRNKKKLKGKNVLITENLTIARVKALKIWQEKYGMTNVWTSDGHIFFKISNNKVSLFRSQTWRYLIMEISWV